MKRLREILPFIVFAFSAKIQRRSKWSAIAQVYMELSLSLSSDARYSEIASLHFFHRCQREFI